MLNWAMSLPMMGLAIVILFGMGAAILFTVGVISLILHLFIAGLIGALADALVPGSLPWGWVGAVLAGLVGSWIGTKLLGHLGPVIFDVPLVPAFVGAVILAFAISALARMQAKRNS